MAHIDNDYPLYYDGMNEYGLGIAGLNFVGNAKYNDVDTSKTNIAQFEFIPYILATCKNVAEAKEAISKINITNTPYNPNFPSSSLHYILKDPSSCIVVEFQKDGTHIYENKTGCLTNNPPFNYQMEALKKYSFLSNSEPRKDFSFDDSFYSRGMGSSGLPGDLSSQSRFIRAAFASRFSISKEDEKSSVNQFFHVLESVWQTRGLCKIDDKYEITIYSSCMNLEKGIYYYKTYDNSEINGISLRKVDLDSNKLITYELLEGSLHIRN